MAGETHYHRLPEDSRPSIDSTGEDERLLTPANDNQDPNPTPSKRMQFKYSFHPTLSLRFISFVLYLSAAIVCLISNQSHTLAASIFTLVAVLRQIIILLHHIFARFIRVRIRIEFRKSGSSITTNSKKAVPAWLMRGFVQVAVDIIIAVLALGTTIQLRNHWYYSYSDVFGAKIVAFIAIVFHLLSVVDLGQPSRLTLSGKFTFDQKDEGDNEGGNPPRLPIYRDVEATGAGEVGVQNRKTGADSPTSII